MGLSIVFMNNIEFFHQLFIDFWNSSGKRFWADVLWLNLSFWFCLFVSREKKISMIITSSGVTNKMQSIAFQNVVKLFSYHKSKYANTVNVSRWYIAYWCVFFILNCGGLWTKQFSNNFGQIVLSILLDVIRIIKII